MRASARFPVNGELWKGRMSSVTMKAASVARWLAVSISRAIEYFILLQIAFVKHAGDDAAHACN